MSRLNIAPTPVVYPITADKGGTGIANNAASTITISGSFDTTLTVTASTSVTLPTTGTLATLAGAETFTNKTFTAPKFANNGFIADANGNELIIFGTTGSAVNEVKLTNAATGNAPIIEASGETNVHLVVRAKGNGLTKVSMLRQAVTSDSYKHNSVILTGETSTFTLNSGAGNAITVTFGITFAAVPVVIAGPSGGTGAPANGSRTTVVVDTKAVGSCIIRGFNNAAGTTGTMQFDWIAMGEL